MKSVDRDTLYRKLQSAHAPTLVEALPAKYWNDWHLPGAKHLPHDQVRQLAPSVLPDRNAEIIVYCASASCQNSHVAARQLIALGYTDVAVYADGKKDWQEAGLPVERGEAVPA